jgi:hypothetical protein
MIRIQGCICRVRVRNVKWVLQIEYADLYNMSQSELQIQEAMNSIIFYHVNKQG